MEPKNKEEDNIDLDILYKVENLSSKVNSLMAEKGKNLFHRYPLTFSLLTLFSVIAVSEGTKGVMEDLGWINHPTYLFLGGIIVLTIVGRLYKKLKQ